MGEWCTDQHGKSGLTAACLASPHTYDEVAANVLAYIQKWIPEKGAGLLAGSSVHADMRWALLGTR
jgi:oligoribonuclease